MCIIVEFEFSFRRLSNRCLSSTVPTHSPPSMSLLGGDRVGGNKGVLEVLSDRILDGQYHYKNSFIFPFCIPCASVLTPSSTTLFPFYKNSNPSLQRALSRDYRAFRGNRPHRAMFPFLTVIPLEQ